MHKITLPAVHRHGLPNARALRIKGEVVTSMVMAGFAAEEALKAFRTTGLGLSGLQDVDLPPDVSVTLDQLGERRVACHQADRAIGLSVAKAVRVKLHSLGLEMAAAIVDVKANGRKRGAHDLVCEIVANGLGGMPGPRHPSGMLSVELKLRRLWSETGRQKVREALRKECAEDCKWWQDELAQKPWCGRLIVMALFDRSGDAFSLRGDVQLKGEGFRGFFGWHGSRPTLEKAESRLATASSSSSSTVAPVVAPLRVQGSALAKRTLPVVAATVKPSWAEVCEKLKPHFFPRRGAQMASVPLLLSLCRAPKSKKGNLSRDLEKWKAKYHWTQNDVDNSKRKGVGKKAGGSEETVATKAVLEILYHKY